MPRPSPPTPCDRILELDLAARIAPVAELVLEPLQAQRIARAVRRETRQQEAGRARISLCEHQECIAHRRGEEPLVADEFVQAIADRGGARGVAAHVGTALLLGHAHADRVAGLLPRRHDAAVVMRCDDPRQPCDREVRRMPQRGHAGIGHRQRTTRALVGLVVKVHQRRACDMRAGAVGMTPCESADAVFRRDAHQRVVRGMELDLVDPFAVAIVRPQLRLVRIREPRELLQFAAGKGSISRDFSARPASAFAFQRFAQRPVGTMRVVGHHRRRLVFDDVCCELRGFAHEPRPMVARRHHPVRVAPLPSIRCRVEDRIFRGACRVRFIARCALQIFTTQPIP